MAAITVAWLVAVVLAGGLDHIAIKIAAIVLCASIFIGPQITTEQALLIGLVWFGFALLVDAFTSQAFHLTSSPIMFFGWSGAPALFARRDV